MANLQNAKAGDADFLAFFKVSANAVYIIGKKLFNLLLRQFVGLSQLSGEMLVGQDIRQRIFAVFFFAAVLRAGAFFAAFFFAGPFSWRRFCAQALSSSSFCVLQPLCKSFWNQGM